MLFLAAGVFDLDFTCFAGNEGSNKRTRYDYIFLIILPAHFLAGRAHTIAALPLDWHDIEPLEISRTGKLPILCGFLANIVGDCRLGHDVVVVRAIKTSQTTTSRRRKGVRGERDIPISKTRPRHLCLREEEKEQARQ